MYRIPSDLNLSPIVGEFATQVHVGRYDLQFMFGPITNAAYSPVTLYRDGARVASWEGGRWPDPGFFDIMNVTVSRWEVPNDRRIVLEFENRIAMHLVDSSDYDECMRIEINGNPSPWII